MDENKITRILEKREDLFNDSMIQKGIRDGIELEEGVALNGQYFDENFEQLGELFSEFTAYPDIYLDLIKPSDSNFTLFFYQRIVLRAMMRFKDVYVTAPRAFSKSFITILGLLLQCIFMPGKSLVPPCFVRSIE